MCIGAGKNRQKISIGRGRNMVQLKMEKIYTKVLHGRKSFVCIWQANKSGKYLKKCRVGTVAAAKTVLLLSCKRIVA